MKSKKLKVCSKCKKEKSSSEFHKNKNGKGGLQTWCKKCALEAGKKYYRKNRKLLSEKMRINHLRREYGITVKKYDNMFKQQKGCCAICGRHQSKFKKRLSVDHNHRTKQVRGLLCNYCNWYLMRYMKDKTDLMIGLIKYLQYAIKLEENLNEKTKNEHRSKAADVCISNASTTIHRK